MYGIKAEITQPGTRVVRRYHMHSKQPGWQINARPVPEKSIQNGFVEDGTAKAQASSTNAGPKLIGPHVASRPFEIWNLVIDTPHRLPRTLKGPLEDFKRSSDCDCWREEGWGWVGWVPGGQGLLPMWLSHSAT